MAFRRSPVRSRSGPPTSARASQPAEVAHRSAKREGGPVATNQLRTASVTSEGCLRSATSGTTEALRLAGIDRARVAEELLSSLEESDEKVATAWATELERRSREVAEGHVHTISWENARTEILEELEQRRAPRTAS